MMGKMGLIKENGRDREDWLQEDLKTLYSLL
jgi:hypothetical protein